MQKIFLLICFVLSATAATFRPAKSYEVQEAEEHLLGVSLAICIAILTLCFTCCCCGPEVALSTFGWYVIIGITYCGWAVGYTVRIEYVLFLIMLMICVLNVKFTSDKRRRLSLAIKHENISHRS